MQSIVGLFCSSYAAEFDVPRGGRRLQVEVGTAELAALGIFPPGLSAILLNFRVSLKVSNKISRLSRTEKSTVPASDVPLRWHVAMTATFASSGIQESCPFV